MVRKTRCGDRVVISFFDLTSSGPGKSLGLINTAPYEPLPQCSGLFPGEVWIYTCIVKNLYHHSPTLRAYQPGPRPPELSQVINCTNRPIYECKENKSNGLQPE